MKMLHLLFLTHHYSGAQTYANQLIPKLRALDHIVVDEVYLNDSSVQEFEAVNMKDVSASGDGWLFRVPRYVSDRSMISTRAPELRILLSWIMRVDIPLIVHCNDSSQVYFAERLREQYSQTKIVYTKHFLPLDYTWHILMNTEKSGNWKYSPDEIEQKADVVICVTALAQKCLCRNGLSGDKIKVIFNGYDGQELKQENQENTQIIRHRLGFKEEEFIILFAGRLEESKGIFELLEAFIKLSDSYDDVRLVLAGTGNYSEILQKVSHNHAKITLAGYLSQEQLNRFYCISDVGVIPSKSEQCSYVALEMMRWKLPIIASDIPGLNELINSETGMLVPVYPCCKLVKQEMDVAIDVNQLLIAFSEMKNNKEKRMLLSEKGYQRWNSFYSVDRMLEQTYTVYLELFN